MTWVRIDDGFARHPKVMEAGPFAIAMQVAALCYCNRELTDGFVPKAIAKTLINWNIEDDEGETWEIGIIHHGELFGNGETVDAKLVINQMLVYGLWDDAPGGYQIHDYHDYQPSKEQVLAERRSTLERQRNFKSRNSVTNSVSNGVNNALITGAPYPYPLKEKKPTVSQRKTVLREQKPIPEDWQPDDKSRVLAAKYGMPESEISEQVFAMKRNYETRGKYTANVASSWATWCQHYKQYNNSPNGRAPQSRVYNTEGTM